MEMKLKNKKLSDEEFYGIQKEVLLQWPTGNEVDFKDAVEHHGKNPLSKSFSAKLADAKKKNNTFTIQYCQLNCPII